MGLDNGLYGKRPDAPRDSFVTFADWRKNWHVHSLLQEAFDGKDEGGFMLIELNEVSLEKAIELLGANPYPHSVKDLSAFKHALDWLREGKVLSVSYQADW